MPETNTRLVLEVGCGSWPWSIDRLDRLTEPGRYVPSTTPIIDEYANALSGDRFICLDNDRDLIRKASENLKTLIKKCPNLKQSSVRIVIGDGKKLPFPKKLVDVVIMSDVLSAPKPGTTSRSEPYPTEVCISERAKWRMILEALRVLKDGGVLVICIHQTPRYAVPVMQRIENVLAKSEKIRLIRQCGKLVRSDNWHLYHAAYQKKGGIPIETSETIPWTSDQEKYIREDEAQGVSY